MWRPCIIEWGIAERSPHNSFNEVSDLRSIRIFEWFAMGWLHKTVSERDGNTIYQLADLRYGLDTNPKESFFSLNVIDTEEGFTWNTGNSTRDLDQVNELLGDLFESAYPSSCDRPSDREPKREQI